MDQTSGEDIKVRDTFQRALLEIARSEPTARDLNVWLQHVMEVVCQAMHLDLCGVFERLEDDQLLLRAGIGWCAGLVGYATVEARRGSQAGYTLSSKQAVVVHQLGSEPRFTDPMLEGQDVRSGVSALIEGQEGPWGVISVYTRDNRKFTDEELIFIQTVASLLGMAIRYRTPLNDSRFRELLETAPDAILTVDRNGRILLVNSQVEKLFGYTREELIGQSIEILLPDHLREIHRHHRENYYRSPRTRPMGIGMELWAKRKDGTVFPTEISLSPLHTDDGLLVSAAVRDITDRRQLEDRLRFLAEASKLLVSSMSYEAIPRMLAHLIVTQLADCCMVDLLLSDGSLQRVAVAHSDQAMESLLREHLDGMQYQPRDVPTVWQVLQTGRSSSSPQLPEGLLLERAIGTGALSLLQMLAARSYMCAPLLARDRALGVISFLTSQQGRYSQGDLELAEELGRRAGIALDNARLYNDLQNAIRVRNEFLALITHDLKNPLAALGIYLEALRVRLGSDGKLEDQSIKRSLDNMARTVAQMTGQVQELLDLAKTQIGQGLELDRQHVSLVELTTKVVEDQRRTTNKHHIQLFVESPELIGFWDATRLERVITNLVSNAIKYSPDGGEIDVIISQEQRDGEDIAVVRVRDHGLGIPTAEIPRIFDRFYRASNARSKVGGIGVGLASAKQIVEQHGGTIEVESEEGLGSTFTIKLPIRYYPGYIDSENPNLAP